MNPKRRITLLGTAILIVVLLAAFLKEDTWDRNADRLKEKLNENEHTEETINLASFTPFEWDEMYSFAPYTPPATIYETVGYKWDHIKETVNEGMNQIVFVHDGKVVCYIYGYPSNNGYGITFGQDIEVNMLIHAEADPQFRIRTEEGIVYLAAK